MAPTTIHHNLEEERWKAVTSRDRSFDGAFCYGVLTTGIYCRPSCRSRLPNRENVRFYATPAQARADGLRACLRCKPDAAGSHDNIAELCRYMEAHADEPLTLGDLGKRAGLNPYHLQRTFKAVVGVTPKQYLDQLRIERFKASLRQSRQDVTAAIFDAGYGSTSRLYEKLDTRLGMTPMEYRGGGRGVEISYASASTPLGPMMVGATDRGLCFIQFGESAAQLAEQLRAQYPHASLRALDGEQPPPLFTAWMSELNAYLAGRQAGLHLPVHVRATAFQLMVWNYLQTIPAGSVQSYGEVAAAIGRPRAVRAVARACASNTVALAIPCHRVIRGTGEMGGYRWGVERKRTLLDSERRRHLS
ncbi:MAG: bifunctional DNA-binding transcriptional regulator/O6-methylguanine-DNA methyltransferase Ada [Acidobacteria bacterium]|nr:bifunctional DNA-binding transcriptional regulator/O6-methylguanine-DNA methyltransferase Ada [Acidobacteriota bacterium]